MRWPYWVAVLATVSLGTAGITGAVPGRSELDPRLLPAESIDPALTYSNVLPQDYLGPGACLECHPQQHGLWREHSHSRMNQNPTAQSVQGDFSGAQLRLHNATVAATTEDGRYLLTVHANPAPRDGAAKAVEKAIRQYQVTRTVGSRVEQFYIGRQLVGPESPDDPALGGLYGEHMLPFVYSFKLGRWLPKAYFDPDGPDELEGGRPLVEGVDRVRDVRPYNMICMNCHNTFAYAYRGFSPVLRGFSQWNVAAAPDALAAALAPHVDVAPTLEGFEGLNARLEPEKHLVTLGISCESCHFGGREHVLHQRKIRFGPVSPYVRLTSRETGQRVDPRRDDPATINGNCTQCHSGHARLYPNGAGMSNSREGLDLLAGHCTSQLTCLDCHEPHTGEGPAGRQENPRYAAACVRCHGEYADDAAAAAHSRHPAASGVTCLDCHMPRVSQGLDELVRTHRVSQPVEQEMLAAGSVNACNLCHLERSVHWTLAELERGWGRRFEPSDDWQDVRRGTLDEPVGRVWLHGEDTHLRLLAAQAFARSPLGPRMLPWDPLESTCRHASLSIL